MCIRTANILYGNSLRFYIDMDRRKTFASGMLSFGFIIVCITSMRFRYSNVLSIICVIEGAEWPAYLLDKLHVSILTFPVCLKLRLCHSLDCQTVPVKEFNQKSPATPANSWETSSSW